MDRFFLKDDTRLISQKALKHYVYPDHFSHNAIWDSAAGPDGKFYYALASEIATSGYVRFCSFDYKSGEVEELFRVEDVILPQERAIRASKFHSSIGFMPDGRIIMTTHTTDKSPRHPTWMPYAYYHHLWEGFSGGQIVVYDPKTKKAETLGTPVNHESIYGSVYCPKNNSLYFLGMMKGSLYRYSLSDRRARELGKVSENYAFRLVVGADQNIYGASRTGWLFKVDTDTDAVIDLNYQLRHAPMDYTTYYNNLSMGRVGADGKLYLCGMYARSFYRIDTASGNVEDMGWYLPTERYAEQENRHGVFGFDFDSKGILWYVVTSLNNFNGELSYGIPASLFCWDIVNGGRPHWCGVVGSPKRGAAWVSEVSILDDDILYIADSNHSLDGPSLIGIDLKAFDTAPDDAMLRDAYFSPPSGAYLADAQSILEQEEIMAANPCEARLLHGRPVLLWRNMPAGARTEDSAVQSLRFLDERTLCGICGADNKYFFTIADGELESIVPALQEHLDMASRPDIKQVEAALPHYPGRQYKAVPSATAELGDGKTLVGTQDGLLAVVEGDRCHAYGACASNGPVHAIVCANHMAYGVAGDEEDITTLFAFDQQIGVRQLGFMASVRVACIDDVFYMTRVRSLAASPSGALLAAGSDERLGTVVIYQLQGEFTQ